MAAWRALVLIIVSKKSPKGNIFEQILYGAHSLILDICWIHSCTFGSSLLLHRHVCCCVKIYRIVKLISDWSFELRPLT